MAQTRAAFGEQIRDWRQRRRLSQLELAGDARISTRHLSFIETGRSRPSRGMVLHLAELLDVPLRERNVLLQAAGYSPAFPAHALDAQALSQALERGTTIASALDDYARTRAAHLAIYQFLSRWLTPLFQSDLDALAWWRDLLFLPLSRMPIARGESLKILTGLKRGWFGRLPL